MADIFQIPEGAITYEAAGSAGDETSRLLGKLQLGSVMMHIEAIAVRTKGGKTVSDCDMWDDDTLSNTVEEIAGPLEKLQKMVVCGREYVVVVTPQQK